MTFALTPRWQSRNFSVAPGLPLFDPVLVQERGLLVTGGPDAMSVFAVGDRQFEWFTIRKKSGITGFAVSASSLYVQDGPALINYDLTLGKPFSALNLVTGARWTNDDSPLPPDSIFQAAQNTAFAPPVVRKHQVEGRRSSQIFSLSMDGRIIAVDTALEEPQSLALDSPPLRPELVLAEIEDSQSEWTCFLYYVRADGGINAVDATEDLKELPGWRGAARPAGNVAPLKYIDGLLVGGGILGVGLFARPLAPAKPPVFVMDAPSEGWRTFDASPREKLLLVSDGKKSRLISYDAAAKSRMRWGGDRVPERDAHVLFWEGTGADAREPGPRLTFEIDKQPPLNEHFTRLRVLLGNTVDSADPALTSNYPPPAVVLDQGKFEAGNTPAWLSAIDAVPCRPVIGEQKLFMVVGAQISGAWTYSVAAFSLAPVLPALLQQGQMELARLRQLARALEVKVTRIDRWYEMVSGGRRILREKGPYPVLNTPMNFALTPGGRVQAATNAEGIARFDTAHGGAQVTVVDGPGPCTSAALQTAAVKTIEISTTRN